MMWLVRTALRRPLTVVVMALLMLVLGSLSFALMNIDIFPAINLPVVMVVWTYPGLSAIDVERRMDLISERAISTTVNDVEHLESESMNGLGLIRVYFYPNADLGSDIAQITASVGQIVKHLPEGTEPPQVIQYNAANVPVAHLDVYSDVLSGKELFDYGLNFIRIKLFTIPGFSSPAPLGGVSREIMVNLSPAALYADGLSAADVGNAISQTNVLVPSGAVKIGNFQYNVDLNMSPQTVKEFDDLPIKVVNGTPIHLGEIGPVSDSHQPATNVVRINGRPATYLLIIKHAAASTLAVVNAVKAKIPDILATAPKGLKVTLSFDQSKFVRDALWDVVQEATVAAALVALMVLVFLGSARSMLMVIVSIPLSILTAIIGLKLSGQSINVMTLGGISLAVGMLVDDATVELENIHRNRAMGKPLLKAILDGANQIATATFIGTLSICIVFFPVVLLSGVARFLFTPLALAVVYAMLTSYLLSRTLVTTMASRLLPQTYEEHQSAGIWGRFAGGFERLFERFRAAYHTLLAKFLGRPALVLICAALVVLASLPLMAVAGEDFFPTVDAGMMRLHVRAATGTRLERTEWIVANIDRAIRRLIPARELQTITDNIGMPLSYDLAFYQTDAIGPMDADIMIQLQPKHHSTASYETRIRAALARQFPDVTTYFQAPDIISQVLNFGLSAAIDAQISGNDLDSDYAIASRLKARMQTVPGLVDLRIAQPLNYPTLRVDVDRDKALELGVSEEQVASSLLTSLSGNSLIAPSFWLDPKNGVSYNVISQVPQENVASINALLNTPLGVAPPNGQLDGSVDPAPATEVLANVANITHTVDPAVIDHYTVQRVIDVNCGVQGRDLGSATRAVKRAIEALGELPAGTAITIRGQSQAMHEAFHTLEEGLVLAVILVYLLMVANFQSWLEPFIIVLAVPGALAGVLWILVLTHTTLNVESLMGTIMAVGVGVANGNLLITFANDLRDEGYGAAAAALAAARIRLRPILMTALAMILGMLPMAAALGAGSEMNAPLGRAVIGGLIGATATTLFVVPTAYAILSHHYIGKRERDEQVEAASL